MKAVKQRRAMRAQKHVVQVTCEQLKRLNTDLAAVLAWFETNVPTEVRRANSIFEIAHEAIGLSDDTEGNVARKIYALSWLVAFDPGKRMVMCDEMADGIELLMEFGLIDRHTMTFTDFGLFRT